MKFNLSHKINKNTINNELFLYPNSLYIITDDINNDIL